MKVESLADWDRAPARDLLACSLLKQRAFVQGGEGLPAELDAMAAAGLIEHHLATPAEIADAGGPLDDGPVWVVDETQLGKIASIRLAHSVELLRALFTYARMLLRDTAWEGADPLDMLAELDLRDGGSGEVDDPGAWIESRGSQHVGALRRRCGLDGPSSRAREVSCHAS